MGLCVKCGLPQEICACSILEKEEVAAIKVYTTKKKFKKLVTIVEGLDEGKLAPTAKELKKHLACGGTEKEGIIILQGDHKRKIRAILVGMGFASERIKIQ
ncbi:stress response translation initiation inhibitor YciH [Candidatus Micrarchaeota archaeon CG11_big_fil_rev_8_21_14_0_20_47_5]|nr:MAG: translation initiation factor [Candidatus Micrarchaeota archaeon CG1_02_47_40]PIN84265.1 MAG: stress response translation initiation inhibitor YciH [Candidatus Micrarchaeota archaeon CG11_big_fil_rev_8_21_14_0_20_47_5]